MKPITLEAVIIQPLAFKVTQAVVQRADDQLTVYIEAEAVERKNRRHPTTVARVGNWMPSFPLQQAIRSLLLEAFEHEIDECLTDLEGKLLNDTHEELPPQSVVGSDRLCLSPLRSATKSAGLDRTSQIARHRRDAFRSGWHDGFTVAGFHSSIFREDFQPWYQAGWAAGSEANHKFSADVEQAWQTTPSTR